ncbi:MAG: tripartite tricarboxylate transporter permease [Oribacterium sp.]|nr:tripartite tricarboxylate transporter permease [Oribacterium sp.]MDY6306710.1 tripartite tricarboxylate transporter permease [Oribacterium sp.]MDY6317798.1 tripartite tricarboxylate transporter permease [Oribacterium sp.]
MITNFLLASLGVIVGIIFGAIPGMTATMAVAVFLPMTYAYDLVPALYLLLGLYIGGISGGLIPAILINIPGTPSAITTTFEGYPMAKRGEGERALKIGITASFIGGMISLVALAFFTPLLSAAALKFSAVEKFLIILFALTVIAALSNGQMLRGVFSGFLGVLVALIGMFSVNNSFRMVPKALEPYLSDGFQLLPVLIGLFAISQIFEEAEEGMNFKIEKIDGEEGGQKFKLSDIKGQGINIVRSALIGTFMGVLPGVGGSAASILAYSQAKSWSKHPEKYGTGYIEGLWASEASNNGLTGGAMIPLLSLGIPGDSTTAVLISAFMLQGIQVGPMFIVQNPDTWHQILLAMLLCNIIMFIVMFYPIKWISKVIYIPRQRMYPVIIMICIVGAYAAKNGRPFDVWTLLFAGIVGYLFGKIHMPKTCFLIGFILGKDLENYFIQSISASKGSLLVFFTRPIGWIIWLLIIASVAYAVLDAKKQKERNAKLETEKAEAENK